MSDFELAGIFPANPTPRYESDSPVNPGDINYDALEDHLDYLADGGVHGVTLAGCTGMASEFSHGEHIEYVERAAELAWERGLDVIAGTATNSTSESYELATQVEEAADIDAHLMISPYKVKQEPDGVETHYEALADGLEEPVVLYDVPSRTGRQLEVDSVVGLAEHDNIIGVKDATGDFEHMWRVDRELERNEVDDFNIVSGDDPNSHFIYELENGTGTISVTGNVDPEAVMAVWETAVEDGDYETAYELNEELSDLHSAMFVESNPGPVHAALATMGFDYDAVPSPLSTVDQENREQVESVLSEYNLLEDEPVIAQD